MAAHPHPRPVPVCANGTPGVRPSAGQQLRQLVSSAYNQRWAVLRRGVGSTRPEVGVAMGRLRSWLDRNPWPSHATVRAFPLVHEVALCLPHNAAYPAAMQRLHDLITQTPH